MTPPERTPGKLTPEDIRDMVRLAREAGHARSEPRGSHLKMPRAARPNARPEDPVDLYFDQEADDAGKAALLATIKSDPEIKARWCETREMLRLLRATPMMPDRTERILASVDRQRQFLDRSTRLRVWGTRAAMAAGLALTIGAAIWVDRSYPTLGHPRPNSPLTALEHAGRQDAQRGVKAIANSVRTLSDVVKPFALNDGRGTAKAASDPSEPSTAQNSGRKPTKLALGSSSYFVADWSLTNQIPSTSGGRAAEASLNRAGTSASRAARDARTDGTQPAFVAVALPDLRVLRCDWEPDSTMQYREEPSAADRSWWLRAWMHSASTSGASSSPEFRR